MSDASLDRAAVSGAPAAPGDEELLAGLAAGRLEALDALYERYASMAYGIARRITGDDWRNPVVWERYAGHFSPYLQRRIGALRRPQAPRRLNRKGVLVLAASRA